MNHELVEQFAMLFQGGKIAADNPDTGWFGPMEAPDGAHYPARGNAFQTAIEAHLTDDKHPIGVYPLYSLSDTGAHVVEWGCIDWDDGEEESLVHARNTQEVLRQTGITSWIERSRSKGYHLWIFNTEPTPASLVRESLIAACQIVDAPTREVNPKQTSLTRKGWGNGVRLPYPAGRKPGRNECVEPDSGETIPLETFVDAAYTSRVGRDDWISLHSLYRPPAPVLSPTRHTSAPLTLGPFSAVIRAGGPRPTMTKPTGDRSATLFALACAMWEEGHGSSRIIQELVEADQDWGNKYGRRPDGQRRLEEIVESSRRKVMRQ